MTVYNTIIIGGGSSGLLSAIHLDDKKSIMLEKNDTLGKCIDVDMMYGGQCWDLNQLYNIKYLNKNI